MRPVLESGLAGQVGHDLAGRLLLVHLIDAQPQQVGDAGEGADAQVAQVGLNVSMRP